MSIFVFVPRRPSEWRKRASERANLRPALQPAGRAARSPGAIIKRAARCPRARLARRLIVDCVHGRRRRLHGATATRGRRRRRLAQTNTRKRAPAPTLVAAGRLTRRIQLPSIQFACSPDSAVGKRHGRAAAGEKDACDVAARKSNWLPAGARDAILAMRTGGGRGDDERAAAALAGLNGKSIIATPVSMTND